MKRFSLTLLAIGATAGTTFAQSAWLPAEGELLLTPGYTFFTFDKFLVGKQQVTVLKDNNARWNQHAGYISTEYGVTPRLAADLTLGYVRADTGDFAGFGRTSTDGLADTSIGFRYQLLKEGESGNAWTPTVAIRVGAIIEGTYKVDYAAPLNLGDGASGFETSLLFGKQIGGSGFGLFGDIGYRWRSQDVPEDIFGSAGVFQRLGGFTLSFAYRHTQALSGGDIGGPGFGATYGFPQVKEVSQLIEGGLGYTDKGGRTYQFTVAQKIDGRNTGEKFVLGFAVTLPFQLGR